MKNKTINIDGGKTIQAKLKEVRILGLKRGTLPEIQTWIAEKDIKTIAETCDLMDYVSIAYFSEKSLKKFLVIFIDISAIFKRFSLLQKIVVKEKSIEATYLRKEILTKKDKQQKNTTSKNSRDIRFLLRNSIAHGDIPPFAYTYPTRSSYRKLDSAVTISKIWNKDENITISNSVNLYVHYPFCRYKCGFCNLYTVAGIKQETIDRYTLAVVEQIQQSASFLKGKKLLTIYLGGGTPMLMSKKNFGQIVDVIEEIYPNWKKTVEEFCIEASPDSVVRPTEPGAVEYFIERGLTRANLGIQTTSNTELTHISRPYTVDTCWKAMDILKKGGLQNLSTDLIMGFHGQTEESFIESVYRLAEKNPETISTYFLTIRPDNRFGRLGTYSFYRDPKLYRFYDRAREILYSYGYVMDSNIRYIKRGKGGYKQKVYQFKGVPVLGVGAGARSYTNTTDYIIGGNANPSHSQIESYIEDVWTKKNLIKGGYVFNDEERIRKRFVLDLFDLETKELEKYHYSKVYKAKLKPLVDALIKEKLVESKTPTRLILTKTGYKYRDIISWFSYSDNIIKKDMNFYNRLKSNSPA